MVLQTDVAIIGAGPVGLFAVFQCGMLGLSCHVLDSLPEIGGQCSALYPEKPIYDIPGFPDIAAGDLIARLEAQAAPFAPTYHLGHAVTGLAADGDGWILTTANGLRLRARAVILAAGAGAFGPNRPPLDGIEAYENRSVFYMVRRREDLRGRRVVIAGGGDSAVDWAVALADVAKSITVVHRRHHFRAAPDMVAKMDALAAAGRIDLRIPAQLSRLEGAEGEVHAVVIHDDSGVEQRIEADILLPFFGLVPALGPIAEWGLALDRHQITINPATAETSRPGIYAIGDIASYSNKLKLILTGFAEAAQAAHAIYARLNPDKPLHMEHSTSKGLPVHTPGNGVE